MVERRLTAEVMGPNPILFFFFYSKLDAKNSASFMEEDVFRRTKGDFTMHYKRVKTTYDRGYVNAMDKIRVFIESNQKVMYIGTGEYANASTAQASYTNAINLIRAGGLVRAACNRGELFLIRNDI